MKIHGYQLIYEVNISKYMEKQSYLLSNIIEMLFDVSTNLYNNNDYLYHLFIVIIARIQNNKVDKIIRKLWHKRALKSNKRVLIGKVEVLPNVTIEAHNEILCTKDLKDNFKSLGNKI